MNKNIKQYNKWRQLNNVWLWGQQWDDSSVKNIYQKCIAAKNIIENRKSDIWKEGDFCVYITESRRAQLCRIVGNSIIDDSNIPFYDETTNAITSSGESLIEINPQKIKRLGWRKVFFKIWRNFPINDRSACFSANVNAWKIEDGFTGYNYTNLWVRFVQKSNVGYKIFIYDGECNHIAFRTYLGFTHWLKNRNLKLDDSYYGVHNYPVIGSYKERVISDIVAFESLKKRNHVFPTLDNGDWTEAVFVDKTIIYLNCNVKTRRKFTRDEIREYE